jgi:hypothetical protein
LGIIGHGLGHGGIAHYIRNHTLSEGVYELPPVTPFGCFHVSRHTQSLVLDTTHQGDDAFTYTQTVPFICFSWNQLSQPRANKNFAYALYAAAASLPLKLLAWLESMACGNFIIHYGGHLLYDSYIPLSLSYFIYAATTIRKNWQLVWSMRRFNS